MTSLADLKSSDLQTQIAGFESLKADVYPICYKRLNESFPHEIDDVVMEVMKEVFEQVDKVKTDDDLAKATSRIAMFRAINRWKELMAKKRGEGLVESLEGLRSQPGKESTGDLPEDWLGRRKNHTTMVYTDEYAPQFKETDSHDIQSILETLQRSLKLEHKQALQDVLEEMSYEEISQKRGWPMGSVCVYVNRGIKAMREQRQKHPQLTKEAMRYIVKMLL